MLKATRGRLAGATGVGAWLQVLGLTTSGPGWGCPGCGRARANGCWSTGAACTQIKIYEDEDKARKEEIEALGGEDKVFSKFYDRLKEIREYHRKFPNHELTEVSKRAAGRSPTSSRPSYP